MQHQFLKLNYNLCSYCNIPSTKGFLKCSAKCLVALPMLPNFLFLWIGDDIFLKDVISQCGTPLQTNVPLPVAKYNHYKLVFIALTKNKYFKYTAIK